MGAARARFDGVRAPLILSPDNYEFPPPELALTEPNGLLAVGGDLSPTRLINAYRHGIFPWFDDDAGPILWWSPDPRAVIYPDSIRITRSLRRRIAGGSLRITMDLAFPDVVSGCAGPRANATGTWITPSMQRAYCNLHELGYAHSVETWLNDELVGGLYGIALGRIFSGESMFSRATDASKVALVELARALMERNFELIDCQMMNPHLRSLGAEDMPRRTFLGILERNRTIPSQRGPWRSDAQ